MKRSLDNTAVYLALSLLRESDRKALAGTGQTRRRDRSSAVAIANHIVTHLRRSFEFRRNGAPIEDNWVAQHLADVIWNLLLKIAEDHAGVDAKRRELARQIIAEAVFQALTAEFETVYAPERYIAWGNGPN